MEKLIITRQVDELGRIPVPYEFRKELGLNIKENNKANMSLPDESGVITIDFNSPEPNTVMMEDIGYLLIRKTYKLERATLEMWIEDNKLKLKKITPQCILSGETTNLIKYKNTDFFVSRQTIRELYKQLLTQMLIF